MAENRGMTMTCRIHDQESYKYYCKQCKKCICVQCLDDLHDDHTFCKLKSAEEHIRNELKTMVHGSKEDKCENICNLKLLIEEKQKKLEIDKCDLTKRIEEITDTMIASLNESKKKSLSNLNDIYAEISSSAIGQQEKLENLRLKVDNMDTNSDFTDVVENLMGALEIFESINDFIDTTTQPNFIENKSNISIGQFESSNQHDMPKTCNLRPDNTDEKEQPCAQAVRIAEPREKTKDVVQKVCPLVISNPKLKEVHKIIPLSQDDAWILAGICLWKVKLNILEDTVYCPNVRDFAVLSDGCILITKTRHACTDGFVRKLVQDRRVVPFADVGGRNSYFPSCISVLSESVIVSVCQNATINNALETKFIRMDIFTMEGVKMSSTSTQSLSHSKQLPFREIHCNRVDSATLHYFIFNDFGISPRGSVVQLLTKKSGVIEISRSFRGIFGTNPEDTFECVSACVDEDSNVLVSDQQYKCVYALDKNLKFKSVVVKNSDFDLKSPQAIAVSNGILWLADSTKIYKFNYDSKRNTLV